MPVKGLRPAAAILGAGLALAASAAPAVGTADTTPPSVPGTLFHCPLPAAPGSGLGIGVSLCWGAATDDVGVTGYDVQVKQDGVFTAIRTTASTGSIVSGLTLGQLYTFRVIARDAAGNAGPPSNEVTQAANYLSGMSPSAPPPSPTSPADRTPPSAPTGLRVCGADFTNAVPMCWNASTDDTGVTGYDVYMKQGTGFTKIGSTTMTLYAADGLVAGTSYTFYVVARDAAGNTSQPSATLTATAQSGLPSPSPSPADRTPPTRPGSVQPYDVYVNGAAGLMWTRSTDNVAVSGYDVYAWIDGAFSKVPAQIFNQSDDKVLAVVDDLTPGRDYLFYVVAKDAAGNLSGPSDLVRQRAMVEPPGASPSPGTDTTPPGMPTGLTASSGMSVPGGVFLSWNTVSDNSGVPPLYDLFRRTDHGYAYEGENATPRDIVTGLEGGQSYTFQVVARDAAGNLSLPSAPYTAVAQPGATSSPSPSPSSDAECRVTYAPTTWGGGFTVAVTIANTGTTAINGWSLAFAFPGTQKITPPGWSATWTQTGANVTAANLDWNKTIKPGQSVHIGFNGTYTGANPTPIAFTLNGTACTTS
ncbi:cellulose binding domain-containing protein [Microbispora sp. H13382]|uniref:cellulose binding domain-containing protein n=1 Tax=Microbispora sp. H13382 TaxID=2729112 RepID=UPI001603FF8F|nr:cellulose binding domain-containing protein [Microbispora sp. H13382]